MLFYEVWENETPYEDWFEIFSKNDISYSRDAVLMAIHDFEKDVDGSLKQLEEQITSDTMGLVRDRQTGTPEDAAWRTISRAEPEQLSSLIAVENPRIGAVILSKLTSSRFPFLLITCIVLDML